MKLLFSNSCVNSKQKWEFDCGIIILMQLFINFQAFYRIINNYAFKDNMIILIFIIIILLWWKFCIFYWEAKEKNGHY